MNVTVSNNDEKDDIRILKTTRKGDMYEDHFLRE